MAYYHRYDDHYRRLYEQGIEFWSDGPDHCGKNIRKICSFLLENCPCPDGKELLDVGCGEGHLATHLADLGFFYTGVDCSGHAIHKAKERVAANHPRISFAEMDILSPDARWTRKRFDVVLDQACLHMFVLDADRKLYLRSISGIVEKDGFFYLSNQARDEKAYDGPIDSIDAFERHFGQNMNEPKRWEAWGGDKWVWVELPRFASRPRSGQGYVDEFRAAGFSVDRVVDGQRWGLDFKLTKSDKAGALPS